MTTPTDLLESASSIAETPGITEALSRAVVSRGYYAAYHSAKSVADRLLLPPPAKQMVGSHERIYLRLLECTPGHSNQYLSAKSIGMMALRVLKPYRQAADYKLDEQLPKHAEKETLARAKLILEKSAAVVPK